MKAVELINNDVPPIRPNESLSKALSWMEEFSVNHLPVVKGGLYVGLISLYCRIFQYYLSFL